MMRRALGMLAEPLAKLRDLYVLPHNLWVAFAIYLPLGFINVTSFKLYLPLLRSLVVCDVPVSAGLAAYSGSLYCGDRNLVISVALQQEAWLVGVKMLFRMLSGPVLGALCDAHGRKPILMLSIGGITLALLLMLLACVQRSVPPMVVLTLALGIQGATTCFGLCFKAIVADSLATQERAKGFVALYHMDVLSRGCTLAFVIYIQKIKFVHYEWLCLAAFSIGVALLSFCHCYLEETLQKPSPPANGHAGARSAAEPTSGPAAPAGAPPGPFRVRFPQLATTLNLATSSTFLQLRLLQMVLLQLGGGWESVQDSFMMSVLSWDPGDWDLANVPISSFREVWGMVTSGMMVQWVMDPANRYWYIQASLAFGSLMMMAQNFAPFGAAFMLVPRCLLALCPGDGGADAAFFSSQFPGDAQATANGLLTAADNVVSGAARWLYARFFFDPSARGWAATCPLLIRTWFILLGNAICLYCWWRYGRGDIKKKE